MKFLLNPKKILKEVMWIFMKKYMKWQKNGGKPPVTDKDVLAINKNGIKFFIENREIDTHEWKRGGYSNPNPITHYMIIEDANHE